MTALLIALTVTAVVALLVVLVGYLRTIGQMVGTIEETLVDKVAPGARDVAGHLTATSRAAGRVESEFDALLRP
jgi:Trk-type K+ transport system membrane component